MKGGALSGGTGGLDVARLASLLGLFPPSMLLRECNIGPKEALSFGGLSVCSSGAVLGLHRVGSRRSATRGAQRNMDRGDVSVTHGEERIQVLMKSCATLKKSASSQIMRSLCGSRAKFASGTIYSTLSH